MAAPVDDRQTGSSGVHTDSIASTSGVGGGADITCRQYTDEHDLPTVMSLIDNDLSEPYSIFTYRYFLSQWPHLCFLAYDGGKPCGVVVCKMDVHREKMMRGYIAMLVVNKHYRGHGIGSRLACKAIQAMIDSDCEEVVLEAEVTNTGALALYRALGFIRDKRLHRYYLNGNDAYRLKLLLPATEEIRRKRAEREASRGLVELGGQAAVA